MIALLLIKLVGALNRASITCCLKLLPWFI
jgi:hypothetical protein